MQTVQSKPDVASPAAQRSGLILAVVLCCQLMLGLDATVVTVALPHMRELHFSTAGLAWVQNAYLLAYGGLLMLGGRAGDILGRRRVFAAGVGIFTLASIAGGFAVSPAMLVVSRAIQGASAAFAGPTVLAFITSTFQGHARAKAMSLYSALVGAGGSVGLLLGGVLTQQVSWRWIFFINVPIGVFVVVAALRLLPETPRVTGSFDLLGALLAVVGMTVFVHGFVRAASDGWGDALTVASLVGGVLVLSAFIVVESRAVRPLLPLHLLTTRSRAGAYGAMVMLTATLFGIFFFGTQLTQEVLGFGAVAAGAAFLPTTLAQFALVRSMPRIIQRVGMRLPILLGIVTIVASLAWLSRLSPGASYFPGVFGPFLLMGVGGGMCIMPLNLTAMNDVPAESTGAASGLAQTMLWFGGALGPSIFVSIAGTAARHHAAGASPTSVLLHSMTVSFAVAIVMPVLAFAAVLVALPRVVSGRAGRS